MIVRPIIILGLPRSGTVILQRCLMMHPSLWHTVLESHHVLEGPFHPAKSGYESNRVMADDVDEALAQQIRRRFYLSAINLSCIWQDPSPVLVGNSVGARLRTRLAVFGIGLVSRRKKPQVIRFLEKTSKNTVRVAMLAKLFPDALFIWNKRKAAANIDSLIAGWHAVDKLGPFKSRRRFARTGYPIARQLRLLDYPHKWWKFVLVPGWRNLEGKTVADVAAWQYYQCNYFTSTDLTAIEKDRVFELKHEEFIQRPVETVRQIFEWANLPPSPVAEEFARVFPRVSVTPGAPRSPDGLRYPKEVRQAMEQLPTIGSLQKLMGYNH